jgi:hypothetical protein
MTYSVITEPGCALTVEFRVLGNIVVEDAGYLLTASSPVHLTCSAAALLTDDGQAACAARAYNKVTGSSLTISAEQIRFVAKPYLLAPFASSVIGSAPGAYLVRYRVDAYPSLTAEVLFIVDDNDQFIVGVDNVVSGKSEVSLTAEEAAQITDGGLKAGDVVAYQLDDGSVSTVSVVSSSIGTEPGTYVVTYRVDDEPGTVISVTYVVTSGSGGGGNGGGGGGGTGGGGGGGTGGGGSRPGSGSGTTATGDPLAIAALLLTLGMLGAWAGRARRRTNRGRA